MKSIGIIDHVGRKSGIDYYSGELAKGFVQNGVEVDIFSNFKIQYSGVKNYEYFPFFIENKFKQFFSLFRAYVKSARKCRQKKISIVIVHLFTAQFFYMIFLILLKLYGIKMIVISHDVESFARDEKSIFKYIIYNYLAFHVVVHNQFSYKSILKYCKRPEKISVIQQGGYINLIDNSVSREFARETLGFTSENKVILFFGQIKKVKRLDLLLKAVPKLQNGAIILIAGKVWKDSFDKYQELIEKLGIENNIIKHIRYIDDNERELFLKSADILVLPYEEIFQSAVLLMGMSYRLAVIASDIEAFSEVINGKNGLLFKSGNAYDLSKTINKLLENPQKIKNVADEGYNTIMEKFSWTNIAAEYISKVKLDNL